MTKWILAAGAAALAITSPALAERGGQGGGKGGQQAAKAEKGDGQARAAKADRGGGNSSAKADRGGGNSSAKADRGGGKARVANFDRDGGNRSAKIERGGGNREARSIQRFASGGGDKKQARAVRVSQSSDRVKVSGRDDNRGNFKVRGLDDNRGNVKARDRGAERVALKSLDLDDRRVVKIDNDRRVLRIDNDRVLRIDDDDRFDRRFAGLGLIDGCPPGLARKFNGCLPPGQAKKVWGNNVWGLGGVLPESYYGSRFVPTYYRDYDRSLFSNILFDDDDYYYRYGNGYVYRVDRDYNIIAGLIPLLGGGYSVGQPYPLGFGVYNVPNQYRTYYVDDDDYYYRYGDGGIYQVDRSTGLIAAIVSLLAGGLSVGQPMPLGYDAYNMPLAYRTTYYDTPDAWYRYNDGYVYQVEPRTRLVQRVIVV